MNKPVVLFTGALTGIGGATAQVSAGEGARPMVSGRGEDKPASLTEDSGIHEMRPIDPADSQLPWTPG